MSQRHFSTKPSAALLTTVMAALMLSACASSAPDNPNSASDIRNAQNRAASQTGTYNENELISAVSTHLGVTSESAATAIERLFRERGRPVGYITGEEGGGALTIGLRYGTGTLWMKNGQTMPIKWQGPTVGFDAGADVSKVFTLVYGLEDTDDIYRRFPGVDGSAYLVGGMAVNYQRTNGITLAPIRTGVGLRLGANVGYTRYTKKRAIIPF